MKCPDIKELPLYQDKTGWPWTEQSIQLPKTMPNGSLWPRISIVTPSYNQGQFLEETIRSVLLQGYPNLEFILIDGGSTDNSIEIIEMYEKWITYWISEKDRGQSNAINKGLKQCTGDIFNWLNSDDYLEKNSLKIIAENLNLEEIDVVCGYNRKFDDKTNETILFERVALAERVEKSIPSHSFLQLPTFYKLNKIKEIGAIDENLNYVMDEDLWIRYLLMNGQNKITYIDDLIGHYRFHLTSKTVSQHQEFQREYRQIMEDLLDSVLIGTNKTRKENNKYLFFSKKISKKIDNNVLIGCIFQFLVRFHKNITDRFLLIVKSLYFHPKRKMREYRHLITILFPTLYLFFKAIKINLDKRL